MSDKREHHKTRAAIWIVAICLWFVLYIHERESASRFDAICAAMSECEVEP